MLLGKDVVEHLMMTSAFGDFGPWGRTVVFRHSQSSCMAYLSLLKLQRSQPVSSAVPVGRIVGKLSTMEEDDIKQLVVGVVTEPRWIFYLELSPDLGSLLSGVLV